jgi:uracil DNA glycosylase
MSADKIKSTIENLSQKYEETSWKNILPPTFGVFNFQKLLTDLLVDKQKGINWTPSFKDLFYSFSNIDLKDIEVVILTEDANLFSTDALLKQGVLHLSTRMFTASEDPFKYDEDSYEVMFNIASKLAYQTTGKIFVFIGENPTLLSKCVDNKHHRKVFLPSINDEEINLNKIINNMLKEPINWD